MVYLEDFQERDLRFFESFAHMALDRDLENPIPPRVIATDME